ncbi:hypothetical protein [Chryseobacterium defluvii]|uniref:Uncharacterized protein n=1 Tax=Chryseobacterium defluvii TaxID=160396 RepID=A0A495S8I5_9FLAO|nr:hypothetical protein [Chryseobacterium defluvii]RKS96132.1 hypothetical protein BCF58_2552 [Chryseobacterium defluvii]
MKKLKIEIIAMILLWIHIAVSLIVNPSNFNPLFSIGIMGLLLSSLLYLKFKDYSLIILLVILFLGSFNLIQFSTFFKINISFLNLPIGILFVLVLYRRYYELKESFLDKTHEEKKEDRNRKIQFFKNKFQNLSIEELENNLNNNHLVDEAKIATKTLLKEKNI